MATLPKAVVGIHEQTRSEHGYETTYVRVMHGRLVDVRALIAGTWDNRAGYGTPEAAERMNARYRGYLADGFTTIFETPLYAPWLEVRFLHSSEETKRQFPNSSGYCEPTYKIGEYLDSMERNIPLMRKCAGRYGRDRRWIPPVQTPDDVCKRFRGALLLTQTGLDPYGYVRDYAVIGMDLTLTPDRAWEAYAAE